MNQNAVANTLALTQFAIALFVAVRVFYLYSQARQPRLFILGLSMSIFSLTTIASFIADNFTSFPLNVKWFEYTSQTVCFLFILLSLTRSADGYLRRLMDWYIIASLLLLLLLTPIVPASFPDPALTKSLLGGSRSLICLIISLYYIGVFSLKQKRFSLLMGVAFQLMSLGYWLNMFKYFSPHLTQVDQVGDVTRIVGLISLLIAILLG
jgi:hypothetical protein